MVHPLILKLMLLSAARVLPQVLLRKNSKRRTKHRNGRPVALLSRIRVVPGKRLLGEIELCKGYRQPLSFSLSLKS
jgi:hypothetical protein